MICKVRQNDQFGHFGITSEAAVDIFDEKTFDGIYISFAYLITKGNKFVTINYGRHYKYIFYIVKL